ncbi:Guanylate kinase [Sulfurovum sp. enrichment culture clone C5]|uniref:Guanylate kinase n=1 Tax=Sulfurovum sp. enrichment culture clone C5 TaxID=497650 RepID=A0A0S4XP88_9BACT|nr:Guanylate kinase [Sulfurovum sp. enrichment culture clone C5]
MSIVVISGPSGAGKSTIINKASEHIGSFYFSISTTTRLPRAGEMNGREYFFVTKEEFEADIKEGNFLEYAKVHDNYYGTSLKPVLNALNEGKLVIFDIDVQGHKLVQEKLSKITTSVFITPPSLSELENRLKNRSLDNEETIMRRLENAKKEIKSIKEYDYIIINDDIDRATDEFISVCNVAKLKLSDESIDKIIFSWEKS